MQAVFCSIYVNIDLIMKSSHKDYSPKIFPVMKTKINIVAALLTMTSISQGQDKLPRETEIALQKLTEWETKEKATLDKSVQAKRRQVAGALKAHLKRATQAGDLKTANLIQARIDELSTAASLTAVIGEKPMSKTAAKTAMKKATEEKFIGMELRGSVSSMQFGKRGKLSKIFFGGPEKGQTQDWKWEVIEENKVEVTFGTAVFHYTLTSDTAGAVKYMANGKLVREEGFKLTPIASK